MLDGELASLRNEPALTTKAFKRNQIRSDFVLCRTEEPHIVDIARITPTIHQRKIHRKQETLGKEIRCQRTLRQTMPVSPSYSVRAPGLQALPNPVEISIPRARIYCPQQQFM